MLLFSLKVICMFSCGVLDSTQDRGIRSGPGSAQESAYRCTEIHNLGPV